MIREHKSLTFKQAKYGPATIDEIMALTARAWGVGHGLKLRTVCNGARSVSDARSEWRYTASRDEQR